MTGLDLSEFLQRVSHHTLGFISISFIWQQPGLYICFRNYYLIWELCVIWRAWEREMVSLSTEEALPFLYWAHLCLYLSYTSKRSQFCLEILTTLPSSLDTILFFFLFFSVAKLPPLNNKGFLSSTFQYTFS